MENAGPNILVMQAGKRGSERFRASLCLRMCK